MPSASAKLYRLPNDGLLVLGEGDIKSWSDDAIVNAGEAGVTGAQLLPVRLTGVLARVSFSGPSSALATVISFLQRPVKSAQLCWLPVKTPAELLHSKPQRMSACWAAAASMEVGTVLFDWKDWKGCVAQCHELQMHP